MHAKRDSRENMRVLSADDRQTQPICSLQSLVFIIQTACWKYNQRTGFAATLRPM